MDIKVKENTELKNLLKLANLVSSGGEAKYAILEGEVVLNGEVTNVIRKKLKNGDVVEFNGEILKVVTDGN
ncbi:ribosome-associated protein [Ezakiella coagulans]|uniref:Ribosome-associated protein n=1 Tax=Ezakiella coagulans TaxID=46507 RepID=A0A2U1DND6_9FIRM|nr:RNA-binding S4 domain-containing protein [Ezakiella coagulans]PVY89178.1 ribosome-associated protein [Ezakiella coagulans]UQK59883.1 RNA-binding S4 domain-containing protein [Ezakiella coagulans]